MAGLIFEGEYAQLRAQMLPGDVIAFGGKGSTLSSLIKAVTRGPVSHVGVVLQTSVLDEAQGRYFNQVIESTSLNGFTGVTISRLSSRIDTYEGDVWWLPLSSHARDRMDSAAFWNFLFEQEGKPYDSWQAWRAGIDALDRLGLTYAEEDFSKLFCSELVAGSLEAGGVLHDINASEWTPLDVCRAPVFGQRYYQLSGALTEIPGFGSLSAASV